FLAAASVATGFAPAFALAVAFRGAGGAGSSVLFAALYHYLLKVVPKDRMARTLGVFYGSFNVGFIAGGPIGGLIAHLLGLASPLFFYAALCFTTALLYLRFVSNPGKSVRPISPDSAGAEAEGIEKQRTWTSVKSL